VASPAKPPGCGAGVGEGTGEGVNNVVINDIAVESVDVVVVVAAEAASS